MIKHTRNARHTGDGGPIKPSRPALAQASAGRCLSVRRARAGEGGTGQQPKNNFE